MTMCPMRMPAPFFRHRIVLHRLILLLLMPVTANTTFNDDDSVVDPALPVPGRPLVMSEHNTEDFYTTQGYEGAT